MKCFVPFRRKKKVYRCVLVYCLHSYRPPGLSLTPSAEKSDVSTGQVGISDCPSGASLCFWTVRGHWSSRRRRTYKLYTEADSVFIHQSSSFTGALNPIGHILDEYMKHLNGSAVWCRVQRYRHPSSPVDSLDGTDNLPITRLFLLLFTSY